MGFLRRIGSEPGTYALLMGVRSPHLLQVGALGPLDIPPGWYLYLGSALGPGGLAARLAHHARAAGRPRWHVDHLRAVAVLHEIWYSRDPRRREPQWVEAAGAARGARAPFPGFGAGDSGACAHLLYFARRPWARAFSRRLHRLFPGHPPVRRVVVPGRNTGAVGPDSV